MTVTVSPVNFVLATLLSLSVAFICWNSAPARTVEVEKALAVVVKEKPAAHPDASGSAGNPSSSQSGDEDNKGSDDQDDDDASPDPDEVYQA